MKKIHTPSIEALRLRWGQNPPQIEGKIEGKQLNLSRINVFNLQFHSLLSFIFLKEEFAKNLQCVELD